MAIVAVYTTEVNRLPLTLMTTDVLFPQRFFF